MIAHLHIQTAVRGNITYLKKAYCTPPFKIADIRENKRDKALPLILMTSSPGVLDGDDHRMKIELEKGCILSLHTQSYQRLFDMQKGASQQLTVQLADDCSFSYLPHPVVPHKNSSFTSATTIYLSDNCSLIWGEVLTCGRKLNGEEFLFTKYHSITEIFFNKKLIIKENLLMSPLTDNIHAIGQMEGYSHQATFIFLDEKAVKRNLTQLFLDYLRAEDEITSGISATPYPGIIVRLLGHKAEQLFSVIKGLAEIIEHTQAK
jgi:urease accessory protein